MTKAEAGAYQANHLELAQALAGLVAAALAATQERTASAAAVADARSAAALAVEEQRASAAHSAAELRAAALQQTGELQTELNERAARAEEIQRQLDEYRALYEQNSQRADELAQRLSDQEAELARREAEHTTAAATQEANLAQLETEHALTAAALHGQLQERTEALRRWNMRVGGLLKQRAGLHAPVSLANMLDQELLVGSRALAADAGVIYLAHSEGGQLFSQAEVGLAETLPATIAREGGLVAAAVTARETVVVDDLLADARWGTQPAAPSGPASGNGSNGAGHSGPNGNSPEDAADDARPVIQALGSNGHYRSALVLPLTSDDKTVGALLFLSARPSAFDANSLPLAQAAASQVLFAIHSAEQDQLWRQQVQAIEQWIAEAGPLSDETAPAADETIRRLPVTPRPPEPVHVEPVVAPIRPRVAEPAVPAAPSAWRRWALPVGALLLVLCLAGAAIANRGALQQAAAGLFGGAAVQTPTATLSPTQASPLAPTLAPTVLTAATATLPAPTESPVAPTATPRATATPAPTATEAPTASPTVALPPDVIGLATVVLPEGIVGRLRDAPNGNVIGGVPGDTPVQVLQGRETTSDQIVWVHIRLPSGQSGWFSEGLIKYTATPVP